MTLFVLVDVDIGQSKSTDIKCWADRWQTTDITRMCKVSPQTVRVWLHCPLSIASVLWLRMWPILSTSKGTCSSATSVVLWFDYKTVAVAQQSAITYLSVSHSWLMETQRGSRHSRRVTCHTCHPTKLIEAMDFQAISNIGRMRADQAWAWAFSSTCQPCNCYWIYFVSSEISAQSGNLCK